MLAKHSLSTETCLLYLKIISPTKSPFKVNPFHNTCWNFRFALMNSALHLSSALCPRNQILLALWHPISLGHLEALVGEERVGGEGSQSISQASSLYQDELAVFPASTKGNSPYSYSLLVK